MPTVAFRVTRSRRKFIEYPKVKRGVAAVLDNEAKPLFVDAFKEKVSDWNGKPDFQARKFIRTDKIWIDIFPAGEYKQHWIWVSRGTRGPYPIPKGGPSFLAFTAGYSARTKPRGQAHVGSGTASGPFVAGIMQFDHPGIEPREFEEVIREDNAAEFSRIMENGWRRVIRSL